MKHQKEFHSIRELEQLKESLATAVRCPVYINPANQYDSEYDQRYDLTHINDDVIKLNDRSALWNERDKELSYISSDQYHLVQHDEVLELVQDVVGRTLGELEMGVIRDYGSQIDGTLVFSNLDEARISVDDIVNTDGYIPPEGQVDPYGNSRARDVLGLGMRISNSFDGKKKFTVSTMGYRFICQNWMVWGEEEIAAAETRHVVPEEFENSDELSDYIQSLIEDVIGEVFEIRDDVMPIIIDSEDEEIPLEWVPGMLKQAGFGANYAKRITGRVLRQETQREDETTAWRLYTAATTELDNRQAVKISKPRYDHYQDVSWDLLGEPTAPEEEMSIEEMENEFAIID